MAKFYEISFVRKRQSFCESLIFGRLKAPATLKSVSEGETSILEASDGTHDPNVVDAESAFYWEASETLDGASLLV